MTLSDSLKAKKCSGSLIENIGRNLVLGCYSGPLESKRRYY